MSMLTPEDLAYCRATQQEAQPTLAALLPLVRSDPGRDRFGGVLEETGATGDGDLSFTVGAWNTGGNGTWYGDAYVEYRTFTANLDVVVLEADTVFTLDGTDTPYNSLTATVWPEGEAPGLDEPGPWPSSVGGVPFPGHKITLEAGKSYTVALQVYGEFAGATANFGDLLQRMSSSGTLFTIRIDNDPNPPQALATEHGIHLVRITTPVDLVVNEGDTLKVSDTEEYRVVSHGDTDPWTTAQRLWAVRVVRGAA